MTTTYTEYPGGRITVVYNDTDVIPAAHDEVDKAENRNRCARAFLQNGDAFEVSVKVGNQIVPLVQGIARADADKMCSIFVRVRAEADVDAPEPEPTEEPV